MKTIGWLIVATLMAGPVFAGPERGYVEATGGLSGSATPISTGWIGGGSAGTQFGAEVKRHLFVIGELGRMKTLQPAGVEASLDTAVSSLSANDGVDVTGQATLDASYVFGGMRFQGVTRHRIAPYAMAGLGNAHLTPSATLLYTDGSLPGSDPAAPVPAAGSDVTTQMTSAGVFTAPAASNGLMMTTGAGAAIDIAKHVTADVGYRLSHINTTTAITTQGVSFGLGLRF